MASKQEGVFFMVQLEEVVVVFFQKVFPGGVRLVDWSNDSPMPCQLAASNKAWHQLPSRPPLQFHQFLVRPASTGGHAVHGGEGSGLDDGPWPCFFPI